MDSEAYEEQQLELPLFFDGVSTDRLMERIAETGNLQKACRKVKANKGCPGVDGMRTEELEPWLRKHEAELRKALLEGKYDPRTVKGVQIPKPGGGVRQLGIPTVIDRLIQQAILQVLDPIFDPTFDCNIYVRTMEAGQRVMESVTRFLEKKLKLKVNREKSCVAETTQRKFLGYRIYAPGKLTIAPKSIERLREKIRQLTKRRTGKSIDEIIRTST